MSFFNTTKCGCYSSLHFLEDNPWIYVQGDSAFCLATTVTDCSPLALLFKSLWERSYIDTLKKNLFWCCLSVKNVSGYHSQDARPQKNSQTLICIIGAAFPSTKTTFLRPTCLFKCHSHLSQGTQCPSTTFLNLWA